MNALRMGPVEWVLLIVLSVLWGGSFFFGEVALDGMGPLTVVLGRVGLAALALWAFNLAQGVAMPTDRETWVQLFAMGALNNVIPFTLIIWGQVHIEGGLASILNATTPLFTVLLAHLLTADERMTGNKFAGVAVGFAGAVVLIGPDALSGVGALALAQVAVLAGACSYAFAGIYGRRLSRLKPQVSACGMLTGSAVRMVPLAFAFETPGDLLAPSMPVLAVAALALASTAVAYLIYFRILKAAGATNLLLVTFLIPVSALALGAMFLGESLGLNGVIGMGLIFVGLALVDGRVLRLRPARA